MKELSIFVDESGDFGEYDFHSPFYIISLVFHNQINSIDNDLNILENKLSELGLHNHCVHAGPIIRGEEDYYSMDIPNRKRVMSSIMNFARHVNFSYYSIYIEKKHIEDSIEATGKLSKQLSRFIKDHYDYFTSFDVVKIYYDNGQIEVTRILSSVFNSLLENVEFRKVFPSQYRLFQVADLICTITLTELKLNRHICSTSEKRFFIDERTFKKNYLKPLKKKMLK